MSLQADREYDERKKELETELSAHRAHLEQLQGSYSSPDTSRADDFLQTTVEDPGSPPAYPGHLKNRDEKEDWSPDSDVAVLKIKLKDVSNYNVSLGSLIWIISKDVLTCLPEPMEVFVGARGLGGGLTNFEANRFDNLL